MFVDERLRADAEPQQNGVVVGLDGRLDDLERLARELRAHPGAGPHALVAAAWTRWGENLLSRLRGSFGLLVWDGRSRRGVLAVDQLGAGGLFVRATPGRLAFASELARLVPLLPHAPIANPGAVARWLGEGALAPGETLVQGVERVRGGTLLRLTEDGWSLRRYWQPRPDELVPSSEAAERLHSAVSVAVARRAARTERPGMLLSGGLDSSLVAAIVHRDRPVTTAYSVVFPNHPATDESTQISATVGDLGLSSSRVAHSSGGVVAPALRYVAAWLLPPSSPTLFFHEPLLALARTDGVELLLDGQGGDELFGLAPFLVADRIRRGAVPSARALARSLAGPAATDAAVRRLLREYGLRGAAPYNAHAVSALVRGSARRAPAWIKPEVVPEWADGYDPWAWKRLDGPRWWAHLAHSLTSRREQTGTHEFLRHMFGLAELEGAHPFLDDVDLVELVLRLPPEPAFESELDRPLVRSAFAAELPEAIRLRSDKSYFNDVFIDALSLDAPALERLLGPGALVRSYIRDAELDRLLARPAGERPWSEAWLSWRLASAECWLRELDRPGFASEALRSWELAESRYELVLSR